MPINSFLYPAKNVPVAYDVANSLRFDDGSNESLSKTPSSAGNRNTWTLSVWFKRCNLSALQMIFNAGSDGSNVTFIRLRSEDTLDIGSEVGGVTKYSLRTSQVFRDVSAWSHLVVAVDTTQATDSNRIKIYINGSQVTNFGTETYPTQDYDTHVNFTNLYGIGHRSAYGDWHYDGYLSEFVIIDGQQLDPTSFGEFDSDSPTIWKPIDVSGLTFGTNGFYLDFENASSLGADVSGNGNNFTVNNLTSVDQSTDTCTNNFCTLNPLSFTEGTLSEGNLEIDQNGSAGRFCASTFQVTQGKWYFEAKLLNYGSEPRPSIGIGRNEETFTGNASSGASSIVYGLENTSVFKGGSDVFTYNSSPASGDIYGVAFDIDNLKIYFHKNGVYANSGNPGNGTGNVTTLVSGTDYSPITGALNANSNSARNNDWQFNFGSPMYSITSGNSDANGFGNFEYAVPSGFFSLCSKNLAEFG